MLSNVPGIQHFAHANSPRFTQSYVAIRNRIGKSALEGNLHGSQPGIRKKVKSMGGSIKPRGVCVRRARLIARVVAGEKVAARDDGHDFRRAKIASRPRRFTISRGA